MNQSHPQNIAGVINPIMTIIKNLRKILIEGIRIIKGEIRVEVGPMIAEEITERITVAVGQDPTKNAEAMIKVETNQEKPGKMIEMKRAKLKMTRVFQQRGLKILSKVHSNQSQLTFKKGHFFLLELEECIYPHLR